MKKIITPKSCGNNSVPLKQFQGYTIILESGETIVYPHTNQYPTLSKFGYKGSFISHSQNWLVVDLRLTYPSEKYELVRQLDDDIPNVWKKNNKSIHVP